MKPCFGYIRVSTLKQGEGVSLEAQKAAIETFAAQNNITITRWFEEKETAAKKGRAVFSQMIAALKKRHAAGVVMHKIDRSARNFADWAVIGELSDSGIDIHFATESLDFRSRGGRLVADIQAVIAADFIRNLRSETLKGMEGRLKQGLYPFKAPLGYLDNGRGKVKTIDPYRGPLVRKLFELYATGNYPLWSLTKAAKQLALCNQHGQPLAKTSIEKILRNPFYMGLIELRSSGQVYQGAHEPLISACLFEQVTDVRRGRKNKKVTKHQHRYRGLFHCGYCQGAMIPELQKGRVYYRCHQSDCATKTVREDHIDTEVSTFLQRYTLSDEQVEKARTYLTRQAKEKQDSATSRHVPLELAKLDKRLATLEDKLLDEVIDNATYLRKKKAILLERKRWEDIAQNAASVQHKQRTLSRFLELVKSLYLTYVSALDEQKREIITFATSNRQVFLRKLVLEPSKWMRLFENTVNLVYGDLPNPTSRTLDDESLFDLEQVIHQLEQL